MNTPRTDRILDNLAVAMTADTREQSKAHSEEACREIEQLETELAAALQLQTELQSALQWAKEELAAVTAERDALKSARDRAQEDWTETARLYRDMKAERDSLIRGEYICKKCGIRKDGEGEKGDF